MGNSFVEELEEVVDEVAEWGAEQVKIIINKLSPDGRPFGSVEKSMEQQLDEYRQMRNDPAKWLEFISTWSLQVTQQLAGSGVSQETIQSISPIDIAIAFASDYAIRMEKELEKRMVTNG